MKQKTVTMEVTVRARRLLRKIKGETGETMLAIVERLAMADVEAVQIEKEEQADRESDLAEMMGGSSGTDDLLAGLFAEEDEDERS